MQTRNVPGYLERLAVEGEGDPESVRTELLLCQIAAIEEQTDAIKELTEHVAQLTRPRPLPPEFDREED